MERHAVTLLQHRVLAGHAELSFEFGCFPGECAWDHAQEAGSLRLGDEP